MCHVKMEENIETEGTGTARGQPSVAGADE
jgi:hypothetical protein